jgi:hypothetical protein
MTVKKFEMGAVVKTQLQTATLDFNWKSQMPLVGDIALRTAAISENDKALFKSVL